MKAIRLIMAGLLLTISAQFAPAVAAKSVSKEFGEAWAERSARYGTEVSKAEASLKYAIDQLFKTDPNNQGQLTASLRAVFGATQILGYNSGRVQVIKDVQALMMSKPSAVRAQMWLQDHIQSTQQLADNASNSLTQAQALNVGENGLKFGDVLKARANAIGNAYYAKGVTDELRSVDQNLSLFYQAKGEEDDRRRAKRAAVLAALGQSMQNMATASQAQQNRNWTATCTRMGMMTTCSGN
jgi:hypothetical protein